MIDSLVSVPIESHPHTYRERRPAPVTVARQRMLWDAAREDATIPHSPHNPPVPMSDDLRFPVGRYQRPASLSAEEFDGAVAALTMQAERLRSVVEGLNDEQLDTPYRPDGWTVRQLVHHVADSHLNMYIRLKLALTEDNPTIKPYDQDAWALLSDVRDVPVATSLALFDAVQQRALAVLRKTSAADRARTMIHPDNGPTRVDQLAALYAWHGAHHIAHIQGLRTRLGW